MEWPIASPSAGPEEGRRTPAEGKVELNPDGGVKVDDEMATNIPGVFAIGDIRNTPFKQVVVAAADGCIAAMSIDRYIKGRKRIRVDWIHE